MLSHTLIAAKEYGMKLFFLPRSAFDRKKRSDFLDNWAENFTDLGVETIQDSLLIPEGGAGMEGLRGAEEILSFVPQQKYTHICTAVGTGTTLAGIINSSQPDLKINRDFRSKRHPGSGTHQHFLDKRPVQNSQCSDGP